jgi:hypothetical protein
MQSNQISIEAIPSSNYRIVNNEECKNELVHEHHLITARIKQTNSFIIHCISCGIDYCELCGKTLQENLDI